WLASSNRPTNISATTKFNKLISLIQAGLTKAAPVKQPAGVQKPVNERPLSKNDSELSRLSGIEVPVSDNSASRSSNSQSSAETSDRQQTALPVQQQGNDTSAQRTVGSVVRGGTDTTALGGASPVLPVNQGEGMNIPGIKLNAIGILTTFTSGLAPPAGFHKISLSSAEVVVIGAIVVGIVIAAVVIVRAIKAARSVTSENGERGQGVEGASSKEEASNDSRIIPGNGISSRIARIIDRIRGSRGASARNEGAEVLESGVAAAEVNEAANVVSDRTSGAAKNGQNQGSIRASGLRNRINNVLKKSIIIPETRNLVIPSLNQFKGANPNVLGKIFGLLFNELGHVFGFSSPVDKINAKIEKLTAAVAESVTPEDRNNLTLTEDEWSLYNEEVEKRVKALTAEYKGTTPESHRDNARKMVKDWWVAARQVQSALRDVYNGMTNSNPAITEIGLELRGLNLSRAEMERNFGWLFKNDGRTVNSDLLNKVLEELERVKKDNKETAAKAVESFSRAERAELNLRQNVVLSQNNLEFMRGRNCFITTAPVEIREALEQEMLAMERAGKVWTVSAAINAYNKLVYQYNNENKKNKLEYLFVAEISAKKLESLFNKGVVMRVVEKLNSGNLHAIAPLASWKNNNGEIFIKAVNGNVADADKTRVVEAESLNFTGCGIMVIMQKKDISYIGNQEKVSESTLRKHEENRPFSGDTNNSSAAQADVSENNSVTKNNTGVNANFGAGNGGFTGNTGTNNGGLSGNAGMADIGLISALAGISLAVAVAYAAAGLAGVAGVAVAVVLATVLSGNGFNGSDMINPSFVNNRGNLTGVITAGDLEGISSIFRVNNGLSPPDSIFASLAEEFERSLNSIKSSIFNRKAIEELNTLIDILNNLANNSVLALRVFDMMARRKDDDMVAAFLNKLMTSIKARGLNNLNGRYFRAARLIAYRYGLPYSSMVQLEAAFILLNETNDFINALNEEAFVKAEMAARKVSESSESAENNDAKENNKASSYDILNNVFAILSSASGYVAGPGIRLLGNMISLGFQEARAGLVNLAGALAAGISGAFNKPFLFSSVNPDGLSDTLPAGDVAVNASEAAGLARQLSNMVSGLIASVRKMFVDSSDKVVKDGSSAKEQTGVGKVNFAQAPPVDGSIEFALENSTNRLTGGKDGHDKTDGDEREDRGTGYAVQGEKASGDQGSSSDGDVKSEERGDLNGKAEQLNRLNTEVTKDQAEAGTHSVRAPPAYFRGFVTAVVSFGFAASIFEIAVNLSHITLTLPQTIAALSVIALAAILIKGGALCALSRSKISEWTTSSTTPRTTQLSQQPAKTTATVSGSSWSMMRGMFTSVTAGLVTGWQSLAQRLRKSVPASSRPADMSRSTKLTPSTATKAGLAAVVKKILISVLASSVILFATVQPAYAASATSAVAEHGINPIVISVLAVAGIVTLLAFIGSVGAAAASARSRSALDFGGKVIKVAAVGVLVFAALYFLGILNLPAWLNDLTNNLQFQKIIDPLSFKNNGLTVMAAAPVMAFLGTGKSRVEEIEKIAHEALGAEVLLHRQGSMVYPVSVIRAKDRAGRQMKNSFMVHVAPELLESLSNEEVAALAIHEILRVKMGILKDPIAEFELDWHTMNYLSSQDISPEVLKSRKVLRVLHTISRLNGVLVASKEREDRVNDYIAENRKPAGRSAATAKRILFSVVTAFVVLSAVTQPAYAASADMAVKSASALSGSTALLVIALTAVIAPIVAKFAGAIRNARLDTKVLGVVSGALVFGLFMMPAGVSSALAEIAGTALFLYVLGATVGAMMSIGDYCSSKGSQKLFKIKPMIMNPITALSYIIMAAMYLGYISVPGGHLQDFIGPIALNAVIISSFSIFSDKKPDFRSQEYITKYLAFSAAVIASVFTFCAGFEIAQGFGWDTANNSTGTFDWWDFVAYGLGSLASFGIVLK
ncbi:MAG: DUF2809 domain-containing protein, partial [Candidatus Omnitrophica bacterium]|nr:DUF2809 domain-containing protein [Candidatus Omnitrophota bacterium]